MAANGGSKKDGPNMVHCNEMFADRIRREQQAAKEWQEKWGIDQEQQERQKQLLKTVIATPMHNFLETTNAPRTTIQTQLGTKKEAIDQTLAKTLYPCTYHLVGKSVTTMGVHPTQKYQFPLTTSQEVGWYANNIQNIEMPFLEGRRIKQKKTF
eukprot:32697_1